MSKTPPVLFLLVLFLSVVALFFSELARAQKGGDPIPPVDFDEDADFGDFDEVPPPVIDIDDDEIDEGDVNDDDDDDVSLSWPPPMPETRHLKQYRVSQLKAFLEERGTTCDACAEKYDWVNRVVDTWNWPRKETIATDSSKTTTNANEEDEMTPEEEKKAEDERLKRMMEELNGDKERDYSGMDPKKASLLKKLQSKGLSFMGGESMDMNQLEQLVNAMDGVKGRSGEDL